MKSTGRLSCQRNHSFPLSRTLVVLWLLAFSSACSSVQTKADPNFSLQAGDGFAWIEPEIMASSSDSSGFPWNSFREAVERELRKRGLRQTSLSEADIFLQADYSIADKVRNNDPYFSTYVAEKYEQATLTIQLLDRKTQTPLWSGESQHRLRYTARTTGGPSSLRWTSLEQPRNWKIAEAAERILEALPIGPS